MSEAPAHIRDFLAPEEYAEHQRLRHLLELARSDSPMSQKELAELLGVSQQSISTAELRGKMKLRDGLLPHLKQLRPQTN